MRSFTNEGMRPTTAMPCSVCNSPNLRKFDSEIAIHVEEGISDLTKPHVFVFPKITICMDCGHIYGQLNQDDLPPLRHEMPRNRASD